MSGYAQSVYDNALPAGNCRHDHQQTGNSPDQEELDNTEPLHPPPESIAGHFEKRSRLGLVAGGDFKCFTDKGVLNVFDRDTLVRYHEPVERYRYARSRRFLFLQQLLRKMFDEQFVLHLTFLRSRTFPGHE